ncbi:MAG: PorT family protein [Saprospiraceae bacterium]|nr:PorT family protein [Saprospiraceae bacterium]
MKKYSVILLALLFGAVYQANAQGYIGFKVGYNAGSTSAAQSLTNLLPLKTLHGFTAGAVGGYNFGPYFALQSELNVTQKGFRISESKGFDIFDFPIDAGLEYWNRFTYLELPILAKAKLGNDIIKAYAAVGPQFSYLMHGRSKANITTILPVTVFDRDLKLDNLGFERFEVSGVGALGLDIAVNPIINLFAEGRYVIGFTDYYKLPNLGSLEIDSNIRNRGLAFSAGMTFNLGSMSGGGSSNRF